MLDSQTNFWGINHREHDVVNHEMECGNFNPGFKNPGYLVDQLGG